MVRRGLLHTPLGPVPVAVKMLTPPDAAEAAVGVHMRHLRFLAQEAHVMSRLRHPNVVRFYGGHLGGVDAHVEDGRVGPGHVGVPAPHAAREPAPVPAAAAGQGTAEPQAPHSATASATPTTPSTASRTAMGPQRENHGSASHPAVDSAQDATTTSEATEPAVAAQSSSADTLYAASAGLHQMMAAAEVTADVGVYTRDDGDDDDNAVPAATAAAGWAAYPGALAGPQSSRCTPSTSTSCPPPSPPPAFIVEELMVANLSKLIHAKDRSGARLCSYGLEDVLRISRDVAAGLSYLHPTVVHRDLKVGRVASIQSTTDAEQFRQHEEEQHADVLPRGSSAVASAWHDGSTRPGPTTGHRLQKRSTNACDLFAVCASQPSNVLLAADGTAKISDFGLARFKLHTALTTQDAEVGTTPCESGSPVGNTKVHITLTLLALPPCALHRRWGLASQILPFSLGRCTQADRRTVNRPAALHTAHMFAWPLLCRHAERRCAFHDPEPPLAPSALTWLLPAGLLSSCPSLHRHGPRDLHGHQRRQGAAPAPPRANDTRPTRDTLSQSLETPERNVASWCCLQPPAGRCTFDSSWACMDSSAWPRCKKRSVVQPHDAARPRPAHGSLHFYSLARPLCMCTVAPPVRLLQVTDRADVYSLGIIMNEMVTRRKPWEGTRNVVIAFQVRGPHRAQQGHGALQQRSMG